MTSQQRAVRKDRGQSKLSFSHEEVASTTTGRRAYMTVHKWMSRNYPRTGRCEWCAATGRMTHLACAGHRYTRNRADWFELCVPCHRAFDDGCGPGSGHPMSEESRRKLSIALKGNKNGVGNKGNTTTTSAATRAKLSAATTAQWARGDGWANKRA